MYVAYVMGVKINASCYMIKLGFIEKCFPRSRWSARRTDVLMECYVINKN